MRTRSIGMRSQRASSTVVYALETRARRRISSPSYLQLAMSCKNALKRLHASRLYLACARGTAILCEIAVLPITGNSLKF